MIVVRRALLILIGLISGIFLLSSGISGFLIIQQGGNSAAAEMVLFWNLVATILLLIIFTGVITRAQSLNRRLDRLIEQGKRRDIVPGRDFQTLGTLGLRLTTIFNQLSRQNTLKTQKISAMHDLVEFLVRNEDQPVSVCDILGSINYASDELSDYLEIERVNILGHKVQDLIPDLEFPEIRSEVLQTRQPKTEDSGDRRYSCYPIEDKTDEIAYLVFLFNSKARFFKKTEKTVNNAEARPTFLSKRLSLFLNRKGR